MLICKEKKSSFVYINFVFLLDFLFVLFFLFKKKIDFLFFIFYFFLFFQIFGFPFQCLFQVVLNRRSRSIDNRSCSSDQS
jgi:hypothetical protein